MQMHIKKVRAAAASCCTPLFAAVDAVNKI